MHGGVGVCWEEAVHGLVGGCWEDAVRGGVGGCEEVVAVQGGDAVVVLMTVGSLAWERVHAGRGAAA